MKQEYCEKIYAINAPKTSDERDDTYHNVEKYEIRSSTNSSRRVELSVALASMTALMAAMISIIVGRIENTGLDVTTDVFRNPLVPAILSMLTGTLTLAIVVLIYLVRQREYTRGKRRAIEFQEGPNDVFSEIDNENIGGRGRGER